MNIALVMPTASEGYLRLILEPFVRKLATIGKTAELVSYRIPCCEIPGAPPIMIVPRNCHWGPDHGDDDTGQASMFAYCGSDGLRLHRGECRSSGTVDIFFAANLVVRTAGRGEIMTPSLAGQLRDILLSEDISDWRFALAVNLQSPCFGERFPGFTLHGPVRLACSHGIDAYPPMEDPDGDPIVAFLHLLDWDDADLAHQSACYGHTSRKRCP